jgi:hypothetical protein
MMKKLIFTILIGLLFQTTSYSQSLYEKKGLWGITYGASINYPTEKFYYTGTRAHTLAQQAIYYVKLNYGIGQYAQISRMFRLTKINETNFLFIEPALCFSRNNYNYDIDMFIAYDTINYNYQHEVKHNTISLDLKLKHVLLLNNDKSIFYNLNFEIGFFDKYKYHYIFDNFSSNLIWSFLNSFTFGYSFQINNIMLSVLLQHELFCIKEKEYIKSSEEPGFGDPFNNYRDHYKNLRLGLSLNF